MDDDTISRQAAIDALAKAMPSLTTPDGCGQFDHDIYIALETFVDSMQIIADLPSAERRGRWINGNEGIWNAVILPKCSICGETFYEMNVNINGEYPYNYCPMCGARMEAE